MATAAEALSKDDAQTASAIAFLDAISNAEAEARSRANALRDLYRGLFAQGDAAVHRYHEQLERDAERSARSKVAAARTAQMARLHEHIASLTDRVASVRRPAAPAASAVPAPRAPPAPTADEDWIAAAMTPAVSAPAGARHASQTLPTRPPAATALPERPRGHLAATLPVEPVRRAVPVVVAPPSPAPLADDEARRLREQEESDAAMARRMAEDDGSLGLQAAEYELSARIAARAAAAAAAEAPYRSLLGGEHASLQRLRNVVAAPSRPDPVPGMLSSSYLRGVDIPRSGASLLHDLHVPLTQAPSTTSSRYGSSYTLPVGDRLRTPSTTSSIASDSPLVAGDGYFSRKPFEYTPDVLPRHTTARSGATRAPASGYTPAPLASTSYTASGRHAAGDYSSSSSRNRTPAVVPTRPAPPQPLSSSRSTRLDMTPATDSSARSRVDTSFRTSTRTAAASAHDDVRHVARAAASHANHEVAKLHTAATPLAPRASPATLLRQAQRDREMHEIRDPRIVRKR